MAKSFGSRISGMSRWTLLIPVAFLAFFGVWMLSASTSTANNQEDTPKKKIGQNYDIRDDGSEAARAHVQSKRQVMGKGQRDSLAGIEQRMTKARGAFKAKNPAIEINKNKHTGAPEIVGVLSANKKLTGRSGAKRADIVRGFLKKSSDLYGLSAADVDQLKTTADYVNPSGNMAWLELEQEIDGIPVFQGNIRAGLTKDGELVRTTGNLVPGIDRDSARQAKDSLIASSKTSVTDSVSTGSTVTGAIASGAESIGVAINPSELVLKESSEDGSSYVFEGGPFVEDIKAELVYFPLESGNLALSWSMTLWEDVPAYYTIVDAETGTVLWRKNITEDQAQPATYSVYSDESPAPLSPFTGIPVVPAVSPGGFQAPVVPRTNFTLISEHPSNNLGWITDGGNTTTGNNVDAGLDAVGPNGIDAGSRPVSPTRVFDYPYVPGTDAPTGADYRHGAITNLFFWSNRYHDILYQNGFTEASRNFQANNFGRNPGGATANAIAGNDFVRAEAQDSSGTNNANFSTPVDGSPSRMQMYIWTGPTPDYDGDLDQSIVIHELTHGTSNRLHNNAGGLGAVVSRGMGEGWSDFYARAILSGADEDVNGIFVTGAYATYLGTTNYTNNYYYGIRRFPHAVKTNVGANGKPHNPLTFADIDPNTINLVDGAFARGPFGVGGRAGAVAVHNIGEVWSMALFEVRARIITRLGHAAGNARMLQLVTDAMKLDPVSPNLLDGRNSLMAADVAFGSEDALDIWAGFATRGMGFGATIVSAVNHNAVESFDNPIPGMGPVTTTEAACGANGKPDVGENLTLSVPLTNPLTVALTDVTAQVVGGGSANYGTIAQGSTVTQNISYQVPTNTVCGSKVTISVVVNSNFGEETKTFKVQIGTPVAVLAQNFDGVTAPALPAGWTTSVSGSGSAWTTSTAAVDSAPNAAATTFAGTTGRADLLSPVIAVPATTGNVQLTFRHSYNTEFEWDGGGLFINIEGVQAPNSYFDILDAGGSFDAGGYPYVLVSGSNGNTNVLQNRAAWTGNSGGFITTTVNLPASAAGKNVRLLFISGSDSSFTVTNSHWRIDTLSLNVFECDTVATTTTVAASAGQYSDSTTLSATVAADCPDAVGSLEFKVNGVSAGTVAVNGTGTYTITYTITNAPGGYPITATFTSSNPYFVGSSGSNTLTVTQENAAVTFPETNPFAVKVNTAGGTAGPIVFCADITEVADGSAGDTTFATAVFSFAGVIAGGGSPTVSAVSYTGGGVGGTRRACVTLTNVPVNLYDVTVTVGGYYTGTGSSILAIYDPSLGFVTGGGRVVNPDTGCTANFGVNVKYQRKGRPQGSILYTEHCPSGDTKLKGNVMESMSIVGNTAVILGKGPLNGVGNYGFRLTVTDNGEPGSSDLFGLRITAPNGSVLPGYDFAPKTIDGGNIQVPQNPR